MVYHRAKQTKKRTNTFCLLLSAVLLIAVVVLVNSVFAKYMAGFSSAFKQADTAKFYFITDLAENAEDMPYPVYDGTIDFEVYNHDSLNVSSKHIVYTVSVTSAPEGSNCTVSIDGVATSEGTLTENVKTGHHVTIAADKDGDYIVNATSSSPYEKTITLYFRVNTHYADSFYTVTSHDGWLELDLYTGESTAPITLTYGALQPDNTIALTATWTAGTYMSGELSGLSAHSHYKLIFFGSYSEETDPFAASTQGGKPIKKSY